MSIDCEPAERTQSPDPATEDELAAVRSPGVPEEVADNAVVPWLDRYESTNALIVKLEDTLRMMENKGVNLTNAWELATTARSLLESADVAQALIYANRSFRLALDVHKFPDSPGVAAS